LDCDVVGVAVPVEIVVSVWLMLTSCCKELTSVNWFTMSCGLMGFKGSWALSCAVRSEIKRLGFPRPPALDEALELLAGEVPLEEDEALMAIGDKLLICMLSLP
jgi:hypothetical protein